MTEAKLIETETAEMVMTEMERAEAVGMEVMGMVGAEKTGVTGEMVGLAEIVELAEAKIVEAKKTGLIVMVD